MARRVLCTGGAGFIGSHLTDELVNLGYDVYVIDNLSTGHKKNINKEAIFYKLDLCNYKELEKTIQIIRPDFVFHLAALARIQPSINDPLKWAKNNEMATLNLLEACRKTGTVKKFVYSSSSSVYGDNRLPFKENQSVHPKHPYGVAKLMGEMWCKLYSELYDIDTTVLRYFNVFGKRQVLEGDYATVIGIFLKQNEEGKDLTIVGDGKQRRDFTHVSDVVQANLCAMRTEGFDIYNVGTGKNYRIKDVAGMIQEDKTKHLFGIVRRAEAKKTLASIKKAKKKLNWEPVYDLRRGIDEVRN